MIPSHRDPLRLHSALRLGALVTGGLLAGLLVPSTVAPDLAWAAPQSEDTGDPPPADKPEGAADDSADKEGAGDATAEEKPPPVEVPDHGGWGVGGDEPEGKYAPKGKTGKLKELEKDKEEDKADAAGPAAPPPPGFAYFDTAIGVGEVQTIAAESGVTSIAPTASFLIGLGYRFGKTWGFTLRYGISTGENNGPVDAVREGVRDPDSYKQIASGGLEVAVRPVFWLSPRLRLPFGLALTMPLGAGDMFADADNRAKIGQATVQEGAAASRGWRDRALFIHNRFGITPSAAIEWQKPLGPGVLTLGGDLSVDLLVRTGGSDPPIAAATGSGEAVGEVNDVIGNLIVGGSAFYAALDGKVIPGVRMWIAAAGSPETKGTIAPGGVSFVFEPVIKGHVPFNDSKSFGMDAHVGVTLPTGTLGGDDASVVGARVGAGFFF